MIDIHEITLINLELMERGITCYYVGGCVRDHLLGIPTDDIDICLVGVADETVVEEILLAHCDSVTPLVGQSFPVWIATIEGKKYDFALARTEQLVGNYRTDFNVQTKNVTIEEDLRRRDLTINAIAVHVGTGKVVDPYDGEDHLYKRIAHPVSEAFKEDSLRVIRAARFIARFELLPTKALIDMCWSLTPTDISLERVGLELKKAMEQAKKPSQFFEFLNKVGWLRYHFKELHDCIGIPQDPTHHPEGDVYTHTLHTIDQAKDWFTRVVMLCHDLGKATTTLFNEKKNKWQALGHEEAGIMLARNMLTKIKFVNRKTVAQIESLVELHMVRTHISEKVIRKTLRHLTNMQLTYDQLVEVCRCDVSGRPPYPKYTPDVGQHRAKELLESNAMVPIITGKKLIANGFPADKFMGELIKKGIEWQDRGTLSEENWLKVVKGYRKTTV